jgi:hypothetical protein
LFLRSRHDDMDPECDAETGLNAKGEKKRK